LCGGIQSFNYNIALVTCALMTLVLY